MVGLSGLSGFIILVHIEAYSKFTLPHLFVNQRLPMLHGLFYFHKNGLFTPVGESGESFLLIKKHEFTPPYLALRANVAWVNLHQANYTPCTLGG